MSSYDEWPVACAHTGDESDELSVGHRLVEHARDALAVGDEVVASLLLELAYQAFEREDRRAMPPQPSLASQIRSVAQRPVMTDYDRVRLNDIANGVGRKEGTLNRLNTKLVSTE